MHRLWETIDIALCLLANAAGAILVLLIAAGLSAAMFIVFSRPMQREGASGEIHVRMDALEARQNALEGAVNERRDKVR